MSSRLFYHSLYDNRTQLQTEKVEVNVWACLLFGFFTFFLEKAQQLSVQKANSQK